MGLFDLLTGKPDVTMTRRALDEAREPGGEDHAVTELIQRVLAVGIDGRGPFASAATVAEKALQRRGGDVEEAVGDVIRLHTRTGAVGGFATSLGGFVTMVAAIPANVFAFFVQATRMTAAVAHLRGHDVTDPEVRTAILLTLVGSNSTAILSKAGINLTGGTLSQLASVQLPRAAAMVIEKAVGFRILLGIGERVFARLGRAIPVAGGIMGAGIDWAMMRTIGAQARHEFPAVVPPTA